MSALSYTCRPSFAHDGKDKSERVLNEPTLTSFFFGGGFSPILFFLLSFFSLFSFNFLFFQTHFRGELAEATIRVVKEDKTIPLESLGKVITDQPDERLNRIVSSMMSSTDSARAQSLGLPTNPSLDTIIREYIADFWKAPVN